MNSETEQMVEGLADLQLMRWTFTKSGSGRLDLVWLRM